jgi:uncharacterized FlaG/YvyC family protein
MKTVTIKDKDTGKVIKQFKIPDDVANTINAIGGLCMDNYFGWDIK